MAKSRPERRVFKDIPHVNTALAMKKKRCSRTTIWREIQRGNIPKPKYGLKTGVAWHVESDIDDSIVNDDELCDDYSKTNVAGRHR